jgi:hypothetical protein
MTRVIRAWRRSRTLSMLVLVGLFATATQLVLSQGSRRVQPETGQFQSIGNERLVSVEPLPSMGGQMCELIPPGNQLQLASFQAPQTGGSRPVPNSNPANVTAGNRPPVRVIHDPYATYSAVTVDSTRNEIILQDENLFQILTYDRMANTPPTATMTEPKRVIAGPKTKVEFNCGLYVDPKTGDIYSIANDTVDTMVVFTRDQKGNVPPSRELRTPHRTFGIAVDEKAEELFLTVQTPSAVVAYRKMAKGNEPPIRIIEGDHTRLEDPHGIALDTKNKVMFVANHGNVAYSKEGKNFTRYPSVGGGWHIPDENERRRFMAPGSGKFMPPSITVYPMDGVGDVAPLRVIEGPLTQLNWPAQMYLDEEHGELYVANDVGDSILVFRASDSGNAAPVRVIKGAKTGIKNPTGVFLDVEHQEIVVANMGNHSATVYPRTAQGNTPPLRTIRGAPAGKQALDIGNPGAVAYDSKRDQVLVPN